MEWFWVILALLVLVAAAMVMRKRRRYESVEDEPWRASLGEDDTLDVDEARRAEDEFLSSSPWEEEDEEPWR